MNIFVPQSGLPQPQKLSPPLILIATISINSMLFPVAILDISVWLYQEIYFRILKIPKIPRNSYVQMNRHRLPGLSLVQKWSCWFCEYTNSIFSWAKAVGNQTEVYSCAIKYTHSYPGQEYQSQFHKPEKFT